MSMYDNFGMNNFNQPNINPFMSFQQPMQQPMQQSMQYQQRQSTQQNQMMRVVENEGTVTNTEVPMDGNAYYFLKADGSEIYAKYWTKEMKTKIDKFMLVKEEVENNKPSMEDMLRGYFNNMESNICSRIDALDEKLLNKSTANKPVQKAKEV